MSFWHERRVFLTGHTGFKGSWLALLLLERGAHVAGYALAPESRPNAYDLLALEGDLESMLADVRDASRLRTAIEDTKPQIVIHLAAQAFVRRGYREPLATFTTNVIGTANLLEAVRVVPGVELVLVVTSDKVYAPGPRRAMREDDPLGGVDPYSASKAAAEIVVAGYRARLTERGIRLATARAGNVIGGGDWGEDRLIPDLVRAADGATAARLRYPQATRPWQHVADVAHGYLRLVEALAADSAIARAWNFGPESEAEATVTSIAHRFLAHYSPRTGIESDLGPTPPEADYLALDASAARRELGWRNRYDLEAGVAATADWYAARGSGPRALRALTLEQLQAASIAQAAGLP